MRISDHPSCQPQARNGEDHEPNAGSDTLQQAPIPLDKPFNSIEREQAEAQLQFQAAILRYVTDSVIVTDPQGIIFYWNEGANAIFGYSAKEMIGQTTAILYPHFDRNQFAYSINRVLSGTDYLDEWEGRRKDGSTVWIDVRATVMRNTQGAAIGTIAIAKDITARKEAEERLCQSEKRFRALIENNTDGIALSDEHGIITYASPSTTRMVGYLPEEIIGSRIFGRNDYPDGGESTRHLMAQVLEEPRKSQAIELRTGRKDGTHLWLEVVGINLLDEPGVEAIVWNFRDVTERKEMEQEVARAKEQLEIILQNVADGIMMVDANDKLIYANNVILRWNGFPSLTALLAAQQDNQWHRHEEFAVWDEWGRPVPSEERPTTQALQGKPTHALVQYRANATGKVYWHLIRAQPIFDDAGQVQFVIIVYTDLTGQKEMEQRKDHFISMASHELKTPLTVLRVYTQLLLDKCKAEGRQDVVAHLSKMNDQITKLTNLVVDLLDISKMQAGQIDMTREAVDMQALAREVVESLRPTTGHRLLIEGEAPGTITGDRERLGQVLIILLNNAIKYSPQADTVVVRLSRTADALTVAVQDFGIGIGKEHQAKLFQRFYRVLSKQDKTFPGMGIGLYIAHEIIQRHGGKMWVESAEGSGSTFFFALPA
jgi:two-component system phosphate regulon sensor histidine kinase PhoR